MSERYAIWLRTPGEHVGRILHAFMPGETGGLRVRIADDEHLPMVITDHAEAVAKLRQIERFNLGGDVAELIDASDLPQDGEPCDECVPPFAPGETDRFSCAECGTEDAATYVVTTLDPSDPSTRTEVCRECDDALRAAVSA